MTLFDKRFNKQPEKFIWFKKQLPFIIISIFVGFLITNRCLERAEDVCEQYTNSNMLDWTLKSFGVLFLLKLGAGIEKQIERYSN